MTLFSHHFHQYDSQLEDKKNLRICPPRSDRRINLPSEFLCHVKLPEIDFYSGDKVLFRGRVHTGEEVRPSSPQNVWEINFPRRWRPSIMLIVRPRPPPAARKRHQRGSKKVRGPESADGVDRPKNKAVTR